MSGFNYIPNRYSVEKSVTSEALFRFLFARKFQLLRHLMFWVVIYIPPFVQTITQQEGLLPVFNLFIDLLSTILLVYFNIYYLYPKFAVTPQMSLYLLFTFLLIGVHTTLLWFVYHWCKGCSFGMVFPVFYSFQFTTTAIIIGAALGLKLVKKAFSVQMKIKELELSKSNSEIEYVKNNINPDFLFRSLDELSVLERRGDKNTGELILCLADMLRYQIYDCQADKVRLSDDIEYMKSYINFARFNYPKLKIDFLVEENTRSEAKFIEPLLFVPILEFVIQLQSTDDGYPQEAVIRFIVDKNKLQLYISRTVMHNNVDMTNEIEFLDHFKNRMNLLYLNKYIFKINLLEDNLEINLILHENEMHSN